MKKILSVLFALLLLVSCGTTKKSNEVNIYTWTYFIPDNVIKGFEKETGIKVNLSYMDTNDTMFAKLLSKTSEYDIVSPSTDFVMPLVKSGLLEKLDKNKLKSVYENLDTSLDLYKISKIYDPNLQYSIPYMLFATGITVNKKYVKNYPHDLSIFNMSQYAGRISMLDDSRETLGMTLQYLGYPSNSSNDKQLEAAKEQILKWKKNLAKFDNNAYSKNLTTGELYIAHGYSDVFYQIPRSEDKNYDFFLPKGAMMYIDSMAITKYGKNKENAYKFLNYIYRPDNYAKFLDEFRTISVLKDMQSKITVPPILSVEEIKKATLPAALDQTAREKQNKIWSEIKLDK